MPESPPHRVARWAASVLVCATLVVAWVVVAVEMTGVAHANRTATRQGLHEGGEGSGNGGDRGSGDGGDNGSGHGGDEGSGHGDDQGSADGGDQGSGDGGDQGAVVPQQTPGDSGQVNNLAPEAQQVPLPAPAPPPASSQQPAPAPPTPASKPVGPRHRRPQASPVPAPHPVVVQQPAPVVQQPVPAVQQPAPVVQQPAPVPRHAVRAPAAENHRTAERARPRVHERHRGHATHPTVTAVRKEPPTGFGAPAPPLFGNAVAAPDGGQPNLSLLAALPAIALLLPLFVVLFVRRRRF
jgi:hypothetical protein